MKITVNGETKTIEKNSTLSILIEELGLTNKRFAVEVNEVMVPKSMHQGFTLKAGDKIEIVGAIGGG